MFYKGKKQGMLYCYTLLWAFKKIKKSYLTVEDRCTDKMMLLRDINDNILVYHLYYLCVYQEKAKDESTKKIFLGGGWNQINK